MDVNKEFYTNYYREINAYRKRQQEHGCCICPASKRYLCNMDCLTCPYAKAVDQLSLDNTVNDSDGNEKSWLNDVSDESATIVEVLEDTELIHALYAKLNELYLQDAVVKTINQMLGDKSSYQVQLQLNIASVIRAS